MTTLNNVFTLLQKFGSDHSMIRTTLFGYDWDVDNKKVQHGIVMRYVNDNANVVDSSVSYEFIVEFLDVVRTNDATQNNSNNNNEKDKNARDVMDDTLRVCLDLLNYLEQSGQEQTIDGQDISLDLDKSSIQILAINDSKESDYWGHQVTFRVVVGYGFNYCEIPLS